MYTVTGTSASVFRILYSPEWEPGWNYALGWESILFNFDIITENLKIKNVSFLYDMEKGKETILSIILKGVIIATIFLLFKLFIK